MRSLPSACCHGLGSTGAEVEGTDFRLNFSDVAMVAADGSRAPVTLDESDWQHAGVALLDFEDGRAACANGTAPMNTALRGTVAAGDYTGVSFKVGVPFEMNHGDPGALSHAPRLAWCWRC